MTTDTLRNPPEIAREAIKQLALRRMTPTPDNYARLYGEISGVKPGVPAVAPEGPDATAWSEVLREFLRAWDARTPGFTQARKREAISRLLDRRSPSVAELHKRFDRLVSSWSQVNATPRAPDGAAIPVTGASEVSTPTPGPRNAASCTSHDCGEAPRVLRGMLAEAVENALSAQLGYTSAQIAEGAALAAALREPARESDLTEFAARLKQLWLTLDAHGAGQQEVVTGLTLLLQLLLSNLAELTTDDRWLKGQLEKLRTLVSGPMNVHSLVDAQRGMRDVIARQGALKQSLDEARHALKEMLASFIDRLGAMTVHTGDFHGKIEGYVARIEATDDLARLSEIVYELLSDTRGMQSDIARTHVDLQAAHKRADEYATKVRDLETRLEQVSGLVCEDPLTSALNRRGLDDAFQKESARCLRGGQPLCVAVLDLDNFKSLNDRLGHQAGDDALVHLVAVVKEAIRPTDVLGRYGGEEFVILLPDSSIEAAEIATVRVQRALTRRFFLHNNERLLITFSAGVAQLEQGESWDQLLERADRALFEAKRAGKNRVVQAARVEQPAQAIRPTDSRAHSG